MPDTVILDSTAYCQGTTTASGQHVRLGEVAMAGVPFGTRIVVSPAVFGRTRFVVLDRYGYGTQLDFYNPSCSAAIDYGRRLEHVRIVSEPKR
jgi:hypothetical protein